MIKLILLLTLFSHKVDKVCLLPFEDITTEEIQQIKLITEEQFSKHLPGKRTFIVLNQEKLPKESYVIKRNRYKSSIILDFENALLKENEVIIGLTHKDICADIHNQVNYGIIGLSRLGKQVCIVSDKRLSNKKDFWKPILHEYIHTLYKAPHCPNDNDYCIMKDAKGKANFSNKNNLCYVCYKFIIQHSYNITSKLKLLKLYLQYLNSSCLSGL